MEIASVHSLWSFLAPLNNYLRIKIETTFEKKKRKKNPRCIRYKPERGMFLRPSVAHKDPQREPCTSPVNQKWMGSPVLWIMDSRQHIGGVEKRKKEKKKPLPFHSVTPLPCPPSFFFFSFCSTRLAKFRATQKKLMPVTLILPGSRRWRYIQRCGLSLSMCIYFASFSNAQDERYFG